MKKRLLLPLLTLFALAFLLVGGVARSASAPSNFKKIGNPAAIYCSQMGLSYATVSDGQGGEKGTCAMPDATTCDAWDFLSGKCGADFAYCAKNGYSTLTLADGKNPYSQEYAVCVDNNQHQVGQATELSHLADNLTSCGGSKTADPAAAGPNAGESTAPLDLSPMVLPASFDWRNNNGNWMTPIKDQGGCGSCWAFSAVGASEAAIKIASKDANLTPDLSEQYLVSDCNSVNGYQNCCGGWEDQALLYIRDSGIPDEACMAYVDGSGCSCTGSGCGTNCTYHTGVQCSDRTCSNRCMDWSTRLQRITSTGSVSSNRDSIKTALIQKGPLTAAIYWSGNFSGSVYTCGSFPGSANHAIDIVGYDDAGQYWIIRNSWGSSWNGDGYFKIGYGECRIEQYVHYAVSVPACYPLSLTHIGSGEDPVASPLNSSDCASGQFHAGEIIALTAAPSSGYAIDGWSGTSNDSSKSTTNSLTMPGYAHTVSVTYEAAAQPAITPLMDEKLLTNKVTFNWYDLTGATGYKLQLSTEPNFGNLVLRTNTPESAYIYPTRLPYSTDYYWRFKPLVNGVYGAWSPTWHFVSMDPIAAPILVSPPNTKLPPLTSGSVPFTWSAVDGVLNYKVQVSNTSDFAIKLVDQVEPALTLTPPYVFTSGKYFWRVKAINAAGGKSPWSEVWLFKVLTIP